MDLLISYEKVNECIDPKEGRVFRDSEKLSRQLALDIQRIINELGIDYNMPSQSINPKVTVKFSDMIKPYTVTIHPGIDAKKMQYHLDKYFPNEYYPETRERIRDDREYDGSSCLIDKSKEKTNRIETWLLGEFRPSYARDRAKIGTVIMYTKAIAKCYETKETDFNTVFWATLVNQAFRAFFYSQFKVLGQEDRWNVAINKRYSNLVQDSFAAYYTFCFLDEKYYIWKLPLYKSNRLMDLLVERWHCFDIDDWPSSGALCLVKNVFFKNDVFCDLMNRSLYDWKTVADILKTGYCLQDKEIVKYVN